MKIYNYHPITKEYISESIADESPLEVGIFLLPANATFQKPPEIDENEVAIFEDENWSIKQDYRGKVYYEKDSGERIVITEIGIYPDESLTDIEPKEYQIWDFEFNQWTEDTALIAKIQQEKTNQESRDFLVTTDWKIIRHKDQLDLGIETSLTSEEYIALLQQRQEARSKVMEVTV